MQLHTAVSPPVVDPIPRRPHSLGPIPEVKPWTLSPFPQELVVAVPMQISAKFLDIADIC